MLLLYDKYAWTTSLCAVSPAFAQIAGQKGCDFPAGLDAAGLR
jgi:hypothetical protein